MTAPVDRASAAIICTNLGKEIAEQIVASLKEEGWSETVGFALMVFDLGPSGHLTFASSAPRSTVLAFLEELRAKIESLGPPPDDEKRN